MPTIEIESTTAISVNIGTMSTQAARPTSVALIGSSVTRCAAPSTARRATTSARQATSASRTMRKVVPMSRVTGPKPPKRNGSRPFSHGRLTLADMSPSATSVTLPLTRAPAARCNFPPTVTTSPWTIAFGPSSTVPSTATT